MSDASSQRRFTVHGHEVDSDFPLPRFRPGSGKAVDWRIRRGRVPVDLPDAVDRGVCWACRPDRFVLNVEGVARYMVADGESIVVEPCPDVAIERVLDFLTDTPLAVLLAQRNVFALRGAAMSRGGEGTVLASPEPALPMALLRRLMGHGFAYHSDEFVVVDRDPSGRWLLQPGPPLAMVYRPRRQPRRFPWCSRRGGPRQALPFAGLVLIELISSSEASQRELKGQAKLQRLSGLLAAYPFFEALGKARESFLFLGELASVLRVHRWVEGRGSRLVARLTELLRKEIIR